MPLAPAGREDRAGPYAGPAAQELIARVQQEYVRRYGGPDATPVDPSEFVPPGGLFLLARDADGGAVGCGGWRAHPAGRGKRLVAVAGVDGAGILDHDSPDPAGLR